MRARAVAYRYAKEDAREQPGKRDLQKRALQPATRFFTTRQAYDVFADLFEAEEAMPRDQMAFGQSTGLTATYPGHVTRKLAQILLQEQEQRAADVVSVDGNFGDVIVGSTDGYWSSSTVDPWLHFQAANEYITKSFGALEPGQELRLYLTYADAYALLSNAAFNRKWGDGASPDLSMIEAKLRDFLMTGYPPEMRAAFRLKVGMASGFTGNIGQTNTADFYVNGGSILFRAFPDVGAGSDGLEMRSWAKGYTLFDPLVETYEDDINDAMIWRVKHAKSLEVYDTTGGVKFKGMVQP